MNQPSWTEILLDPGPTVRRWRSSDEVGRQADSVGFALLVDGRLHEYATTEKSAGWPPIRTEASVDEYPDAAPILFATALQVVGDVSALGVYERLIHDEDEDVATAGAILGSVLAADAGDDAKSSEILRSTLSRVTDLRFQVFLSNHLSLRCAEVGRYSEAAELAARAAELSVSVSSGRALTNAMRSVALLNKRQFDF
ncbi:MAG TPA: hypothetical protein VGH52_06735, partial [Gaiellaceae bacterium]